MSNNIYTVDATNPTVQCIVVRDTRIADVGQLGLSPKLEIERDHLTGDAISRC